jgi:hypothetical protein
MSDLVSAYDRRATELAKLYESLPFEQAHAASLDLIPDRPGLASMSVPARAATPPGSPAVAGTS